MTATSATATASIRIDKWLWFARFFKSRNLASKLCDAHRVRINGQAAGKAHAQIRVGDVLTFAQGNRIRVVRIAALAKRRGPAVEAATLYEDLEPPLAAAPPASSPSPPTVTAERVPGSGRPTKAQRRALDRLTGDG